MKRKDFIQRVLGVGIIGAFAAPLLAQRNEPDWTDLVGEEWTAEIDGFLEIEEDIIEAVGGQRIMAVIKGDEVYFRDKKIGECITHVTFECG